MADNHQLIFDKIIPLISDQTHTLCDYGCGNGYLLTLIAEKNPQIKCTGIDYFEKYKIERINHTSLQWIDKEDVETLSQKKFDIIISTFALHHFQYPLAELKRIYDLLNDQGVMIFFDFSLTLDTKAKIAKSLSSLIGEIEASLKKTYHRHHYTLEEAKDLFQILPAEILIAEEFKNDLTQEELKKDQQEFLEKNNHKRSMIEKNASDFWKSIWLPLVQLEKDIITENSVDYTDLFMIAVRK